MELLPEGVVLSALDPEDVVRPRRTGRLATSWLLVIGWVSFGAAFAFPFTVVTFEPSVIAGLPEVVREPVLEWMISAAGLPVGEHYLARMVWDLLASGEVLLGIALLIFSCIAPALKLAATSSLLAVDLPQAARDRRLTWLHEIERWSMADVFVVALLVAYIKADTLQFGFSAGLGLYFYAASAVLGSLAVGQVRRGKG